MEGCGPGFEKLVSPQASLLPSLPLDQLMKNTGLESHAALLKEHGKAVMDARAFLKDPVRKAKGFLLATDGLNYTHEFFSSSTGLRHWSRGYREMGIHPKAIRTAEFMGKITETGEPIVFLVPPNIKNYPITNNEMQWLLENPDRMKNVTFVFGAYELIPPEALSRFRRTRSWEEIRRLLGD